MTVIELIEILTQNDVRVEVVLVDVNGLRWMLEEALVRTADDGVVELGEKDLNVVRR